MEVNLEVSYDEALEAIVKMPDMEKDFISKTHNIYKWVEQINGAFKLLDSNNTYEKTWKF